MNSNTPGIAAPSPRVLRWLGGLFVVLVMATNATPSRAGAPPDSFADLADRLLPAVVNISTTTTVKNAERGLDMPQLPPGMEEFFKDFMERQHGNQENRPLKSTALGSGFIVDPSGLVVTNNHVIADADAINVILHDGRVFKAELVGRDSKADLAVLRIKVAEKLPALTFGDSDAGRVGDWVLAIGNPYGLGGTVTAGIISARSRDINAGPYDDFIQTDAAINRGNSGGPLFNMKGEVIGINTAIYSQSGGSIGIGFAIPSNLAKPVIVDLERFGKARRGWLGVHIQMVTDEIAESLGLKDQHGALVADVMAGGPAAKAGIKGGDIITRFDGKDVTETHRLQRIVAETPINKEVEVDVLRDGKHVLLKAVVAEMKEDADETPAKKGEEAPSKKEDNQSQIAAFGISVSPVSAATRQQFELPAELKSGAVVTDVKPNGSAAEKGLKPGDVIIEATHEVVKTPADLIAKVDEAKKAGRKSLFLLVQGDESSRHYVALRIDSDDKK